MSENIYSSQDVLTFSAFIQQGLLDNDRESLFRSVSSSSGGYLWLIEDVTLYAPSLVAMANAAINAGGIVDGPIEYESCEAFGSWYGKEVLNDRRPSREQCLGFLRTSVERYCTQQPDDPELYDADLIVNVRTSLEKIEFTSIEDLPNALPISEKTSSPKLTDDVRAHVVWLRDNFPDGEQEMRVADELNSLLQANSLVVAEDRRLLLNAVMDYIHFGSDHVNSDELVNAVCRFSMGLGMAPEIKKNFERLEDSLTVQTHAPAEPVKVQQGFVLAFPGAPNVEADELMSTLKYGGNHVMRVPISIEQLALQEIDDIAKRQKKDEDNFPSP